MLSFYSISYVELMNLPSDVFYKLYNSISVIRSRDALRAFEVQAYTKMSDKDRKKTFAEHLEKAGYKNYNEAKVSSFADLAKFL